MACVFMNRKNDKVWRYKFRDYTGKWKSCAGWPSKRKTEEFALNLEADHRAVREGRMPVPPHWLGSVEAKSIQEAISDYLSWGRTQGGWKGLPWADAHGKQIERTLKKWIVWLNLKTLDDVELSATEKVVQDRLNKDKKSGKTAWDELTTLHAFCRWAVKRKLLASDPLAGMSRISHKPKNPHRTLTEAEFSRLLEVSPPLHRVWYHAAQQTGYRSRELRLLKVKNLDLPGSALLLDFKLTKNREDAVQATTSAFAPVLVAMSEGKSPEDSLLDMPSTTCSNKHLKRDLAS